VSGTVPVEAGQTLPLAAVLVPEQASDTAGDGFKSWAMSRSQAISSDNAIAAGILDDPTAIDNSIDGLGTFSYFPLTGIPGIAVTNPYGLSFWSPFQSTLSTLYFPASSYGLLYSTGWPLGVRYPQWRTFGSPGSIGTIGRWPGTGIGIGVSRPIGGIAPVRSPYSAPAAGRAPHGAPAPHPGIHPAGHR
jgi:hypothetical protein